VAFDRTPLSIAPSCVDLSDPDHPEVVRVTQVRVRTEIRLHFRRRKWAIWSFSDFFFVFGRKWIFFVVLFFVFVPKMSFALGRKCYVRN